MNLKAIAGVLLAVLVVTMLTTMLPVQAQTLDTPTGVTVSQPSGESPVASRDEVSGTTYYLVKYISVQGEGQPGIAQQRDGSRVVTTAIEENVTAGAVIQSVSTSGTSVELPEDLADGWWFLIVGAATSVGVSDYSEGVYFEISSYVTPDVPMAKRWWNVLNGEQMVAALFGDEATEEEMTGGEEDVRGPGQ